MLKILNFPSFLGQAFCELFFFSSYLVEGGCDRSGAGDRGQGVLAPDGLDAADAQREVATEARVDILAVAEIIGWDISVFSSTYFLKNHLKLSQLSLI